MGLTLLNIVGIFRTILIIVMFYLLIKWVSRLLAPNQSNNKRNYSKTKEEGTTTIKYNSKGKKIIDKDKGEYIDFEEVD
jgi:hypothetical protein